MPRSIRPTTRTSGSCSPIPPPTTNGLRAGGSGLAEEPQIRGERRTAMRAVNPAFIPRNHRVEAVIEAAVNRDDFAPFEELLTVLAKPYEDQPAFAAYAEPPQPRSARAADVLRDVRSRLNPRVRRSSVRRVGNPLSAAVINSRNAFA